VSQAGASRVRLSSAALRGTIPPTGNGSRHVHAKLQLIALRGKGNSCVIAVATRRVGRMSLKREIRVYRNRRLYDRSDHRYINYQDLYALIDDGVELIIEEQGTGLDCTGRVLLDLMLGRAAAEDPRSDAPVITDGFLRQLLLLRPAVAAPIVGAFLDHTMRTLMSEAGPRRRRK
jgi:hypothetical protein